MEIHSAPWVLPITSPPIADGAVVVDGDSIVAVGPRAEILSAYNGYQQLCHQSVLMPALVNCHAHLELSHITGIEPQTSGEPFCGWIERLIEKRASLTEMTDLQSRARRQAVADFEKQGVFLIGDIANKIDQHQEEVSGSRVCILPMLEMLAPTISLALAAITTAQETDPTTAIVGHAAYSTNQELLQFLFNRSKKSGYPFSIHAAESLDELQFVRGQTGCFRDFLEKRGSWDGHLLGSGTKEHSGVIEYFNDLGLLGPNSLFVHCVHVSDNELDLIQKHDSSICLCPGSNKFLQVGCAPVETMVEKNINVAIGTDSLASNTDLDMWLEMRLVARQHSTLEPGAILAMATAGGAKALGFEGLLGELRAGSKAAVISVTSDRLQGCVTERELLYELITGGRPEVRWVYNPGCFNHHDKELPYD